MTTRSHTLLIVRIACAALLWICIAAFSSCDTIQNNTETITQFDTTLGLACLACHGDGIDELIVIPKGQWANSAHASTDLLEATVDINGDFYSVSTCGPQCHSGNGFVNWVKTGSVAPNTTPSAINCYSCHLPHTGEYGSWSLDTLRGEANSIIVKDTGGTTKSYAFGESNMCARCHQATDVPSLVLTQESVGSLFGPHFSPQANMIVGAGLYRFENTLTINSHENMAAQNGCNACHFGTGVGYEFGEHTFRLEDEETGNQLLANCNVSGCHVSASGALKIVTDSLFESPRIQTIAQLTDSLQGRLTDMGYLNSSDSNGVALYPDSTLPRDGARILHNYLMVWLDGSRGVHNPKKTEQILLESLARLDSLPKAAFVASDSLICFGDSIQFTSLATGPVTSYSWSFGDGSTISAIANPVHVFSNKGTFTVRLTVSGVGGSDSEQKLNFITVDTIQAIALATPASGTAPLVVNFNGTTSLGVSSYAWDFGDPGTVDDTSSLASPSYTYTTVGDFLAKLVVTGPCGTDSTTRSITVTAGSGLLRASIRPASNR